MNIYKAQTTPRPPMLWIFEDAYVGRTSRLTTNDLRPQARRPHSIPGAQKRMDCGATICTIIAVGLLAILPVAFAKEEVVKEVPKATPKEESLEAYNARMQWFVDSPYGMFIHFGLYSTIGGIWQGKPIDKYAEWIQGTANIDRHEYADLSKTFNPKDFDADLIVRSAKEAGMSYLVITAKHHEGFCLWDSQYTDFDVANTPFKGRDILEELCQACNKYGIKFGLYYSIIDWNHPSQKRPSELGGKAWPGMTVIVDDRKQDYIDYQKNQVLELIKKYDPAVLWFDGDWASWWQLQDGIELYNAIREASPHAIVNNRVAKRDGYELDFVTQEQNHFKDAFPKHWEGCYTMNKSWGYKKNDNNWKDAKTIYNKLKDINEKGGNLLLNVGPDGNGVVQPEAYAILKETAELLKATPIHKKTPQITTVPGVIKKHANPPKRKGPATRKPAIDGADPAPGERSQSPATELTIPVTPPSS